MRYILNLLVLCLACHPVAAERPNLDALDAALQQLSMEGTFSGAVVIDGVGGIRFAKGYGMADPFSALSFEPSTPVDSASLAKPMTAAAVLKLTQERRIDLDAPAITYLPEFPHRATTVRQLLTHSASLPDMGQLGPLANKTNADLLDEIEQRGLVPAFPPGHAFSYCNSCYTSLALIIERVTGEHYLDFLRKGIQLPSGTEVRPRNLAAWGNRAIGYRRDDNGKIERADSSEGEAFYGSANLSISALSLAKWGTQWWTSLSPVRSLATSQARIGRGRSGLALGNWYCAPERSRCHYIGHHEGFHHMLYWDARRRLSIAMVTNNSLAPDVQQRLQRAILAFAVGQIEAGAAELAAPAPHTGARAGSYRTPQGEVIRIETGTGPLLRLTRRHVVYDVFPIGAAIGYAPGLDIYVSSSSTGRLRLLSLYEDQEAVPIQR